MSQSIIKENSFSNINYYIQNRVSKYQGIYVLTDDNVGALYLEMLLNQLSVYPNVHSFSITAGEMSKSIENVQLIYNWLLEDGAKRNSLLINLGGGVVSDIGGFVAATFMRGIDYFNVPTSIIGQIDAAIGGKTAINFGGIKNIVGMFYQPKLVLVDPILLKTLPQKEIVNGWGELMKYAILTGQEMWFNSIGNYYSIITTCVNYKQQLVHEDPYDNGDRRKLNLGHTAGHGLEAYFKLPHGIAVACGLIIAIGIAYDLQLCDIEFYDDSINYISSIFKFFDLPTYNNEAFEGICKLIGKDKKKNNDKDLLWVLPVNRGRVMIQLVPTDIWQRRLKCFMQNYLV